MKRIIFKKISGLLLLFVLCQWSFGQIVVGSWTGITQLSNITSVCDPIVNTTLGDVNFATNSAVEIPMFTAFTGTWANGLAYSDGPGPEILCVSVHTEEWWDVELLLSDATFTPPVSAPMTTIEDYITLDFYDCGSTLYTNYYYDRRIIALDFSMFVIPLGLQVIGARFTLTVDNAANPDPIGMLLIGGITSSSPLFVTNNGPLCIGDSIKLFANTIDSATYSWSGPSAFSSALQNPVIVNASLANAGIYTCIVTDSLGGLDTATTPLIINPNPTATFVLPTLCEQNVGAFSIVGASDTINNYYWDFGTVALNDTSNLSAPNFIYNNGGPYNISLVITSDEGCSDTLDTNLVIHLKPIATLSNSVICVNESEIFDPTVIADTTVSYNWTFPSGSPTSSTDSVPTINFPSSGNINIGLILTTDFGCMDTFSFPFTINGGANPNFGIYPICISQFTFDPLPGSGDSSWVVNWNMGDGTVFNNTDTSFFNYNYQSAGTYNVQMTVTDYYGCIDSVIVVVQVVDTASIKMPNVLVHSSTSGNNKVDLEIYKPGFNLCMDYTYTIFDRWGLKVYEVHNDPLNPDLLCNSCFQGKTQSGNILTSGVYFYIMKGNFGILDKGNITIFE